MPKALPHEKPIQEYLQTIEHLKKQSAGKPLFDGEIGKLELKLEQLKEEVYGSLTAWERVQICRHPERPHALDFIQAMCEQFVELHGDRCIADDPAIVGGIGVIDGQRFMIIAQEKGSDTEQRIKRNFGMVSPQGYRKAIRLMKMAEKFGMPVLSLVDTPGAHCGLEAEERGQGWAIAYNLREMAHLNTPVIVVLIGEGCSGGALGIAVGDVVGMLEHAYYTVITPEGCASILWKDASRKNEAASHLRITSEDLLEFGIIDQIIEEPLGGAQHDPAAAISAVKQFVIDQWAVLRNLDPDRLLDNRYMRYRRMGHVEGETVA